MDCNFCNTNFSIANNLIDHMKREHSVKERATPIKCFVNHKNKKCERAYQTFSGLRLHIKKCLQYKQSDQVTCFKCYFRLIIYVATNVFQPVENSLRKMEDLVSNLDINKVKFQLLFNFN